MSSSTKKRPRSFADQLLGSVDQGEITAQERAAAAEASFNPVPRALLIPIERIVPSRDNPRKAFGRLDDLAESIAERGVLQPLVVRRDPERPGYYITVAGARRLMAARMVQASENAGERARVALLPAIVMDETDRDAFADALAENLAREDLSRAEVMEALLRLQNEYGWSARYIARRTGRSVGDVAELLGIAKDDEIAAMVRDDIISPTTAGQIRRLRKELRADAISGVQTGRIKTVEDVRELARAARTRPISDTPAHREQSTPADPTTGKTESATTNSGSRVSDIGHPPTMLSQDSSAHSVQPRSVTPPSARPDRAEVAVVQDIQLVIQAISTLVRRNAPIPRELQADLETATAELTRYVEMARTQATPIAKQKSPIRSRRLATPEKAVQS